MERILHGRIKAEGCRLAGKRLRNCASVLSEYGILFPPLYFGTINIKLDESFPTPEGEDVIFIPQEKIDTIAPGYCEWWKFIPVKKINDLGIGGYIYIETNSTYMAIMAQSW